MMVWFMSKIAWNTFPLSNYFKKMVRLTNVYVKSVTCGSEGKHLKVFPKILEIEKEKKKTLIK